MRRLIATLHLGAQPSRVIDIGSGTGYYVREWLLAGAGEVIASDFSEAALEQLRARFPAIQAIQLDITAAELPAILRRFDVVSAFDVLFHVTDDDAYRRAIANCYALCRPGGYFVFSELLFKRRHEGMPHMGARTHLLGDWAGDLLGRALFTVERVLVSRCFESKSAQLVVCRRPPRVPNDASRSGDFIATGGA